MHDDGHRLATTTAWRAAVPYGMAVHIGTSGWSYAHWAGVLYPDGRLPRERLDYYVPLLRAALRHGGAQ